LIVLIVLDDVISGGREFGIHNFVEATEKLLSPYLVFERGTMCLHTLFLNEGQCDALSRMTWLDAPLSVSVEGKTDMGVRCHF
jgi:hypothetical protein